MASRRSSPRSAAQHIFHRRTAGSKVQKYDSNDDAGAPIESTPLSLQRDVANRRPAVATTSQGRKVHPVQSTQTLFEGQLQAHTLILRDAIIHKAVTDPFGTSPIVVDEQVYQYLQYHLSVAHERLLCSTRLL